MVWNCFPRGRDSLRVLVGVRQLCGVEEIKIVALYWGILGRAIAGDFNLTKRWFYVMMSVEL